MLEQLKQYAIDINLILYSQINPKRIKNLNVRPEMIKLEETIGKKPNFN